jgi:NAD(P)H dehydrogenase (quinone)
MAQAAAEGAREAGATADIFRIGETLPEAIMKAMGAFDAQKAFEAVPLAKAANLLAYDGFVFSFPTRFGTIPAQVKTFFDSTGQIWGSGGLVGKPVAMMTSSSMQHGGQEATILGALPFFLHHGMVYVGLPATFKGLSIIDEVSGSSFYGASTITGGDGSRKPSANELAAARFQGKRLAEIAGKLAG